MTTSLPFTALVLCFSVWLSAQSDPDFDLVTLEEGVSNGFFTSMYQDKKGFIWLGTASGLHRYDGYTFRVFLREDSQPYTLSYPVIWALAGDDEENLWIGTERGLNKFDPTTEKFTAFFHDPNDPYSLSHNSIECITKDTAGNMWIGTANGLNIYRKDGLGFDRYFDRALPNNPKIVKAVFCAPGGDLWVGSQDTLFQYLGEGSFAAFSIPGSKDRQGDVYYIRTIYEDRRKRLWVGTENSGLFVFEKNTQQFVDHYHHQSDEERRLSHNKITAVLEDADGRIWAATYGGGLNIINEKTETISQYNALIPNSLDVTAIRSMLMDKAGNIWLGSSYEGLYLVKKHKKSFRNYSKKNAALKGLVNAFHEGQNGIIWIGTLTGLIRFDATRNVFFPFQDLPDFPGTLLNDNVKAITEDQAGMLWMILDADRLVSYDLTNRRFDSFFPARFGCNGWLTAVLADREDDIWMGSMEGLCKYVKATQNFIPYRLEANQAGGGDNRRVSSIYEDRSGNIWIATFGGLNLYDRNQDTLFYYPSSDKIYTVFESRDGRIWLGSRRGLAQFNRATERFHNFDDIEGMPESRPVEAILEDEDQRLWFSTNAGLYRFDPAKREVISYNRKDGLISNQLLPGSLQTVSGDMYFNGLGGFTSFRPDKIVDNPINPPILITNFQLFNRDVPVANTPGDTMEWDSPLQKEISYATEIELKHWQNDFSFEFAALDFTAAENNQYQYQLEGYNSGWITTGAQRRFAPYTNLSPGSYVFKVKGSNNDGIWSDKERIVKITILPSWYWAWWSKTLYVLFVAGILYLFYHFQLRRKLEQAEALRLKELDAVKSKLYTNITHEFRTPLTIILGLADQLRTQASEHVQGKLQLIRRNGHQLLRLVNQMLDLSKLESGGLQLNMEQGDIVNYLQYLLESFHSYAASKKIRLHFICEHKEFYMDYDPVRLMYVISNLLSNAVRFTPEGKNVYVTVSPSGKEREEVMEIRVKDTGIGIPEEKLPFIFDRFFQGNEAAAGGTGIGLTLAKELVKLMGGQISVKSELGKGSEFIVLLPVSRRHPVRSESPPGLLPDVAAMPAEFSLSDQKTAKDKPLMLIVEDNPDLVRYLVSSYNPTYNLEVAYNGRQGVDKAKALIPDIIITDVMMPEKDGFELCATLKNHTLTSHIPIIMLTAKVDVESRLTGLRRGADVYLEKPFLQEELHVRIQALLTQRKRLQAYYRAQAGLSEKVETERLHGEEAKIESAFLAGVNQIIEKQISEETFTVEQLCGELFIDPSNLYRKLRALTGLNPSQYIRSLRLARARKLLVETDLPIASVAAECGFAYQNYFSRIFKKETGFTPSKYRAEHRH